MSHLGKIENNRMLLNSLGRLNPSAGCRVFSKTPKTFYKLNCIDIEYSTQHKTAVVAGLTSAKHDISDIEATLERVNKQITNSAVYRDLFKAASEVSIAFSCRSLTISLVRIMPSKKASFLKSPANLYKSSRVLSDLSVYVPG